MKNNKDKKLESQEQVKNIQSVLSDMDSMARGVIRYGMENTGICDLTEEAAERLDLDWHDEDPEVQKSIEDERMALEEAANECCSKIINAIDSVWPVSKLTLAQRKRLEREIEDLNCYGARPFEDPHGYVGCVVADYALYDDSESLNNLEFACENALEEEEEMDESVKNKNYKKNESKTLEKVRYNLNKGNFEIPPRKSKNINSVDELKEISFNLGISDDSEVISTFDKVSDALDALKKCKSVVYDSKFIGGYGFSGTIFWVDEVTFEIDNEEDDDEFVKDINILDVAELNIETDAFNDEEEEEMDESVKKDSKPFKKESKKHSVCESTLSDMDGDVRQWAVDHIVDRLDEMEGMEVELSDLAHELVDRENIDGGVFYNNQQAWEWVANHRYDAGDVLTMMCNEWGTCSPNPLVDPDAFCVVFLEEAIADILEDSATVQDGGKVELTREVIDAIIEEIQ